MIRVKTDGNGNIEYLEMDGNHKDIINELKLINLNIVNLTFTNLIESNKIKNKKEILELCDVVCNDLFGYFKDMLKELVNHTLNDKERF